MQVIVFDGLLLKPDDPAEGLDAFFCVFATWVWLSAVLARLNPLSR